jgi:HEPN domain-containing protein
MNAPPDFAAVAAAWLAKADEDLAAARFLLTMGNECPAAVVCFHAQQSVEKTLKSLLVRHGVEVPRIHDLRRLRELLPAAAAEILSVDEADILTEFAISSRYPGDYEPILVDDARALVDLAARVRGSTP